MPRILMTLFTGSILVVVFSQSIAHQISFARFIPMVNLQLAFPFLICAAGALTLWLEAHPQRRTGEEQARLVEKARRRDRTDRIN